MYTTLQAEYYFPLTNSSHIVHDDVINFQMDVIIHLALSQLYKL